MERFNEEFINTRARFLERFLNSLMKNRLFRGCTIVYNFLTCENFNAYKKNKIEFPTFLGNYINNEGIINLNITSESIEYVENIKKNLQSYELIFKKLESAFEKLNTSMDLVSNNFKEISTIYKELNDLSLISNEVIFNLHRKWK